MHGHSNAKETSLEWLTECLRRRDCKVTGPRQAVLDVLRNQAHPVTMRQVLAALPSGTCDLATVYRSMGLLCRLGLVDRYDFGDGAARYELRGERGAHHHHHHLICTGCSEVVELEECVLSGVEEKLTRESGFSAVRHKLEFFGVCPSCQGGARGGGAAAPGAAGSEFRGAGLSGARGGPRE